MKPMRPPTLVCVLATVVIAGLGPTTAANQGVAATRANAAKSTQRHPAAGSRAVNRHVAWNAAPATGDETGLYTAPAAGRYAIVAASATDPTRSVSADAVASPPSSIDPSAFLPPDRATTWNPGMMGVGGIPARPTVCATLTPRGGGQDDTAQIRAAISNCPAGQVVQLAAGTLIIHSGNYILLDKGINLRGAGPGQTTLAKPNGAQPSPAPVPGPNPSPLVVVGPSLYGPDNS